MAASRSNFAYSIESDAGYDGSSEYGSFGSSGSIQEPKTETCVGAACKKLSNIGKKLKKKFTRKNRKNSYDSLLRGSFDSDEEIKYSDLTDKGSFIEIGGRRKRRRRRTRKKKGGKRRRTRKKRKSRKRRKKRKTRRRR